jgi:thiol-disulfide isomerase/thioredoxin
VQMKTRLEAIANVAVIVVALAVGYVVLGRYVAAYRTPRSVAAGDRLATIPNLDWKEHRHTLLLALNTGCHFCEQSVPFYQKLADTQAPSGNDLEIVAVFPNDPQIVQEFMTKENLRIRSVAEVPLEKLRVNATPTLILIDANGRVERSWVGILTPSEELGLLKMAAAQGCSSGETTALAGGGKESCGSGTKGETKN